MNRWGDDRWEWDGYLALLRCGGVEFGLGRVGSAMWRRQEDDEFQVFFLTTIVGRVWVVLGLFAEVLERFTTEGPWELTLGLRDSGRAVIGNVATGWEEPEEAFPLELLPRCPDPNVLIVREAMEWPDTDGQRLLAFDFGSNIEDAFGSPSDDSWGATIRWQGHSKEVSGSRRGEPPHERAWTPAKPQPISRADPIPAVRRPSDGTFGPVVGSGSCLKVSRAPLRWGRGSCGGARILWRGR